MERVSSSALHPAFLPPGTLVGPWRVVDWAGRGVHGAVYRAVRLGEEQAPPVALKVALLPGDPRFGREVELLSRMHHPNIPRWVDHGEWQHPGGTLYPYVVMEWIDGVPLYDWARLYHPNSQQVLRLLTQLALALQAVHAQGAVHRDVKGDNALVRRSDSRVFLTDFGSGVYPDADTLTPQPLPPGTPAYRSPEAWLFSVQQRRTATAVYCAGPADDLYALGVTACRLVTGAYPELGEAQKDEHGAWRLESLVLPQALLRDPGVEPPLRALILRMLSVRPEQRGTAAQLAQDMERAAASLTLPSTPSSFSAQVQVAGPHSGAKTSSGLSNSRAHARSWWPWLATAAAAGVLAMWAGGTAPGAPEDSPRAARTETAEIGQPDAGPVGLGEAAASASMVDSPEPSVPEVMAEDTPPEPLPGQARPDAKGRCSHKRQVALNGGCWVETSLEKEKCEALSGHMYKGSCYVPIIPPGRPSTATSPNQP